MPDLFPGLIPPIQENEVKSQIDDKKQADAEMNAKAAELYEQLELKGRQVAELTASNEAKACHGSAASFCIYLSHACARRRRCSLGLRRSYSP